MEWTDRGVVIGVRKHGETSVVLDLLTERHGRHLGLVHGGRSRRMRPCLQPGNTVTVTWKARLEEQLGTFSAEPSVMRAARIMESSLALNAVNHLCALACLLPEREPQEMLHARLEALLERIDDPIATPADLVRFELAMLTELGFGLDLERCAATGERIDLIFVSPKTGRAVSRAAGEPYRSRMLRLPGFLKDQAAAAGMDDFAAGFRLAEHFLMRDIFLPRGLVLASARNAYIRALEQALQNNPEGQPR